jgi:hypothetical protein
MGYVSFSGHADHNIYICIYNIYMTCACNFNNWKLESLQLSCLAKTFDPAPNTSDVPRILPYSCTVTCWWLFARLLHVVACQPPGLGSPVWRLCSDWCSTLQTFGVMLFHQIRLYRPHSSEIW